MAEIRSVSVHLDADVASYIAKMKLAGAATDEAFGRAGKGVTLTNTRLTTTERQVGKVDASVRKLGNDVDSTRTKVDTGAKSIDRYSGRLGILTDVILGLGPALVPIGAVAVPAVTALASNFVFAGAGAVTARLAFIGVGNALQALNKAQLQPTAENLLAARQALDGLSPSARQFTVQLLALKPTLMDLRNTAAAGLLPGLGQGLTALEGDLPLIRRGISGISSELGILGRDAGRALASDRWQPFLRFVNHEAPTGLAVMGRSLGLTAHGVAELLMSFQPLTRDFDRGILRVAQDFDRWATSLGRTKGFQDFLTYLRENGPRVVALLSATGDALVNIATAVAPLGGPVLDALTSVIKAISAIAGSDLGTPIFEGILLFRLFTRAEQLWASTAVKGIRSFVAGQAEAVTAIRATTIAQQQAATSSAELAGLQRKASAGWITIGKGAARGAAGLASVGVAASGISGPLASNTVQFGLMGAAIGGPWGAALGAGIGLLADFKGGQDKSAAATADFTSTLNQQTGAITDNTKAMVAKTLQEDGALDAAEKLGISTQLVVNATLGHVEAQRKLQAELDHFTGVSQPGYIAGGRGMYSIDQAQALAAGQLGTEVGKVGGRIRDNQVDVRQLSAALGHNIEITHGASRAHRLLQKDMKAEQAAAQQAVSKWQAFGSSLDDAHKSLSQFIHDLARQADALANFGNNALTAARKGLDQGLIKSLRDAGPEGALRMRQLANASQSEIGKANRAWHQWQGAIDSSTNALGRATSRQWLIRVQTAQARAALNQLSAELNALRDKTIRVTTIRTTGGHSTAGNADGGTIPGPRYPYGDRVLRYVAPGEEVISNRYGQADRHRQLLKAINAGRMADGGTVLTFASSRAAGASSTGTDGVGAVQINQMGHALHGVAAELQNLERALKQSSRELDKERQHRQDLIQQRQSIVSSVSSNFKSDLFGMMAGSSDVWASGAAGPTATNPLAILRGDIANARKYRTDIRRLRRRGLSKAVLGQIDTLSEAEQAQGMTDAQLRDFSRLYAIRQRAAHAAGAQLGDIEVGKQLRQSTNHLARLNDRVHHLNEEVRKLRQEQKDNAKHTGDAVGNAINHGSSVAARRRRPS